MQKHPYNPQQWNHLVPDINSIIEQMEKVPILSVGITPFTRIVPSFFLKNYSIYTVKRSSDVDVMEKFLPVHVLEDRHPEVAKKVHGTGYLIGNFAFQNFLKSRKIQPKLQFYTMTEKIVKDLDRLGIAWIGNDPKTFQDVMYKGSFRELIKKLGLSSLPSDIYSREDFLAFSFNTLWKKYDGAFVVQRADKETGGNEGTFFVHNTHDFENCLSILAKDTDFGNIIITPFVEGYSTSMLGCIMPQGTLSGPLQLQLIDVPQALHGVPANGIFFGNDLDFHPWKEDIEEQAQKVVEAIGAHLQTKGYKGIFGIDFLYDIKRNKIYPSECNPRFTGSLVLYSLMLLEAHVPPMEFFHLTTHLDIESSFDFDTVNQALKTRISCAHIAFSPRGITDMGLSLPAGVYEYNPKIPSLEYKRPGISLADMKSEHEFLIIDTVPSFGASIEQQVPRLFKFIFPRSIARSSYEIDIEAGYLVERFADVLLEAVSKKETTSQT
ncbi:MAG: ATP-grasp domain-containing protein [bacterium]|nr:ATP-grasp domain-containing protein [bacterium]